MQAYDPNRPGHTSTAFDELVSYGDRKLNDGLHFFSTTVGRKRVMANGGLLEVHLGA
jgi:hypothetical protein